MKKALFFCCALLLFAACQPKDPVRVSLERYAKEQMDHPEDYEFSNLSMKHEYTFMEDLVHYKVGLENLAAKAADKAPYEAEIEKVDQLIFSVGREVACFDQTLHYWILGGSSGKMKIPQFVIGRFTPDGQVIEITKDPDSLPTYPALQMLKDRGDL